MFIGSEEFMSLEDEAITNTGTAELGCGPEFAV
jgi:hypothetical protein